MVRFTIAPIRVPAASINLTLPWFTGKGPLALYAHVRSVTTQGASAWSHPFSFDMRWENAPTPQSARPGLIRWSARRRSDDVPGVARRPWPDPLLNRTISTHTNVADLREPYTFHVDDDWWATVEWRVRAIRQVVGAIPNGLPAVSYGPWSPIYASTNPGWSSGKIRLGVVVSDRISSGRKLAPAHYLMPALTWTGDQSLEGGSYRLFRVYIATDRDCVNIVFRGAVVGGPAYAPRLKSLLKLPASQEEIDAAQYDYLPLATSEGVKAFMADTTPVRQLSLRTGSISPISTSRPPATSGRSCRSVSRSTTPAPSSTTTSRSHKTPVKPAASAYSERTRSRHRRRAEARTYSGLTPKGRLLQQAGARPTVFCDTARRMAPGRREPRSTRSSGRAPPYPWRKHGSKRTRSQPRAYFSLSGRASGTTASAVSTPRRWGTPR